jgi:pyruvate dehydrogenase E2 component (dihydrolipoamide acetyltransferase)
MASSLRLPDLGEGVAEAEIERWLVSEGDAVSEDDPLVEVSTDKATVEIPSPFAGTVSHIHAQPGDVVAVGTVLVTIGETSSEQPDAAVPAATQDGQDRPQERTGRRGGELAAPAPVDRPPEQPSADRDVRAMPPVRRLARAHGVDLTLVEGSGPQGRILRADVERFARRGDKDTAGASSPAAAERREPLRGIHRTIAERMTASQRIPAVTHVEECDVTELDATRRLANDRIKGGPRLTYLAFVVKAVAAGLKAAGEVVYHGRYDIGIAVDTPAGLVVPVIRAADRKTLREVASEIERLAGAARAQRLDAAELKEGTFTITSPGAAAGLLATPLILAPQTGILGIHRAVDRPVAREGQVVIRKIMNVSITFDHRVLDGMTAARFCAEVVGLLEHPGALALED